jgi:hypothetical protein
MKLVQSTLLSLAAMFSGSAFAEVIAGGLWGGRTQTEVVCYLFNVGPGSVTVSVKEVWRIDSTALKVDLNNNTCNNGIKPNSGCIIGAYVPDGSAHACKFVVSPSAATIVGSMDARDVNQNILATVELRSH